MHGHSISYMYISAWQHGPALMLCACMHVDSTHVAASCASSCRDDAVSGISATVLPIGAITCPDSWNTLQATTMGACPLAWGGAMVPPATAAVPRSCPPYGDQSW